MSSNDKPACFVATIDVGLAPKLQQDLRSQGFELAPAPHAFFTAKKKGLSCTLYLSGKLTVQGKDKDEFISYYLEPEILQSFTYLYPTAHVDETARIGSDEAGKGDFFGPLCVASLFTPQDKVKDLIHLGVKDSKKLTDKTVVELSKKLKSAFAHKILRLFPEKYNELYDKFHNLNRMLAWCHATAIEELSSGTKCTKVILDQFAPKEVMEDLFKRKKVELDLIQRVRAEEDPVVAAASILARAAFLEGMQQLSDTFHLTLPKGASQQVIELGKEFVKKHGKDNLKKVAKLHFKTTQTVLS